MSHQKLVIAFGISVLCSAPNIPARPQGQTSGVHNKNEASSPNDSQKSPIPYQVYTGPYINQLLAYKYSGAFHSIRQVDFPNLTLHEIALGEKPAEFKLRNGKCQIDDKRYDSHTLVDLKAVHELTPARTNPEYALALYDLASFAGSSSSAGIAVVFELSNQRLKAVQQIDWDTDFGMTGPFSFFGSLDDHTKTLTIREAHYLDFDAHCCVSAMDIVTFGWNGSRFVQTAIRTELTDFGKRQGKKME